MTWDSVKKLINSKTCAVIMETIQGEGGIYPATEEFLKGSGPCVMNMTCSLYWMKSSAVWEERGEMFAWQRYGVKPDIMTTAKALGCGVPVGAFLMTEKAGAHSLASGDHGTTYGGNPLPVRR